jgi:predicted 3-demethylubiquinone-9 3-methyltransferase (glyoxalase superfamily)
MQKITPFLWFDSNAEEAMQFYTSIFNDSKIASVEHFEHEGHGSAGKVTTGTFFLNGQQFMAINGGPLFKFSPAISLYVDCKDQAEIDYYWEKLSEGGEKSQCGWLTDKFGVSWQIVPSVLGELLNSKDKDKAARVMKVMLQMSKLEIEPLINA